MNDDDDDWSEDRVLIQIHGLSALCTTYIS